MSGRAYPSQASTNALIAGACALFVAFMVGAAYAAVPLYNWFCRTTGFNGTTQVANAAPKTGAIARKISQSALAWPPGGSAL